jgi:hypothetical protein
MCSWCFGQDIEVVTSEEGVTSKCRDCEGTDMWLLDIPDITDNGEAEDDEET